MGLPKPTVQLLLKENQDHACAEAPEICVKVMAIAELPDVFGEFQVVAFWNNFDKKEHAALIHGDIFEKEDVPVRLHSECLTGDTLGSLRCDCREQLQESMRQISKMDRGIVLYMRQEGRGVGSIPGKLLDSSLRFDRWNSKEAITPCYHSRLPDPLPTKKRPTAFDALDAKLASGGGLTRSNLLSARPYEKTSANCAA